MPERGHRSGGDARLHPAGARLIQAGEAVEAELHNVRAYLHEAFLRFGDRLRSAMPSGLARGMGLVAVITGAQVKQARKLLGWEPSKLARRAKVHSLIIERAESVALSPHYGVPGGAHQTGAGERRRRVHHRWRAGREAQSEGEDAEVRGAGLKGRRGTVQEKILCVGP